MRKHLDENHQDKTESKLTVLQNLNPVRKGILLQFIYKSSLIQRNNPIVILDGADLSYVDLSGTLVETSSSGNEHEASLNGANLSGAFLSGSSLDGVDL